MDWTRGYVSDIGYTFGYYPELNPLRMRLQLLIAGFSPPNCVNACELGFGQGISINIHSSTSEVNWFGTDFNPEQAHFASAMSSASRNNAFLTDDAFEEYCAREDLPDFDFIALHGIWSWISPENRKIIQKFIKNKLKIGGVVYLSYNTLPGWSGYAPIRHLLTQHASQFGSIGGERSNNIENALAAVEKILQLEPKYSQKIVDVTDRFNVLKSQNRRYLAYEFFNRDWHPMYFSEVNDVLKEAKVEFACSANYLDTVDDINLTPDQKSHLKGLTNKNYRESVRDVFINQQFRKDYWIKGPRMLSTLEKIEILRGERVVLILHPEDVPTKVTGNYIEANLDEEIYEPIVDALRDNQTCTILELEQRVKTRGINFAQLLQAISILIGVKALEPANDHTQSTVSERVHNLNQFIINNSRSNDDIKYLASPITGGGISTPRFEQLFLLAQSSGLKNPNEIGSYVCNILTSQGQKIIKDGKVLEKEEDNLSELTRQAKDFVDNRLSIFNSLKIV